MQATTETMDPPELVPGAGTIDDHDEDDDMRLLVAAYDTAVSRGEAFGGNDVLTVYERRENLLRRTAKQLRIRDPAVDNDGDLLGPRTIRVCASWLLAN